MKKTLANEKKWRGFGLGLGAILALVGAVLFWRQRPAWPVLAGASAMSLAAALAWPRLLAPVERLFSWIGRGLALVNTAIILTLVYGFLITPAAIGLRLFKKDLLDLETSDEENSYWRTKDDEPFDPENYRRRF
ncbi:MAG: hypothetical protein V1816_10045 [Pseudomonadota bacterium]